ncbi:MAG: glycerate kinase [Treponema sp.]|nr:glycerate kinase [Treponema sp.]
MYNAFALDIDTSGLDKRIANTSFTVMCDVRNPLCGKDGALQLFRFIKTGIEIKANNESVLLN